MINLNDLVESLGVTGMLRFLEQFDYGGNGDYTAEKYGKDEPGGITQINRILNLMKLLQDYEENIKKLV